MDGPSQDDERRWRRLRWFLLWAPGALLAIGALALGWRLHAANALTPADVDRALGAKMLRAHPDTCEPSGKPPLVHIDGVAGLSLRGEGFQSVEVPEERFVVAVLGGSSLVIPDRYRTFPHALEAILHERGHPAVRVISLGERGATSRRVCQQGLAALEHLPLDLVVVYSGHNDLRAAHDEAQGALLRIDPIAGLGIELSTPAMHHWKTQYLPAFKLILRWTGALRIDPAVVDRIDQWAIRHWRAHLQSLATSLREAGVPLVVATPIGNLDMFPISADGEGEAALRRGRVAADADERLRWLRIARDSDAFNGTLRAKSSFVAALSRDGVGHATVIDLETMLHARGFDFAQTAFYDPVHFNPETHRLFAAALADALIEGGHCCGAATAP